MNDKKSVTIIGGGIAGLSAAVFLAEKKLKVTLIESSPKLGGRAYSFFDKERNQFFDNGQHILAGWYKNTFEYLKIIGSFDKLNFQNSLEVNFINKEKKIFKLNCPDAAPPLNLVLGLLKFKAFSLKDKFALKNINDLFKTGKDYKNKYKNVHELLTGISQTDNLIKYFWEPFTLAVFNTGLKNIDVEMFLEIFNLGFREKVNSNLVIPKVNLNELIVNRAFEYFKNKKVEIVLNKSAEVFNMRDENGINKLIDYVKLEDGSKVYSDYFISAVPFFMFKKLFDNENYVKNDFHADKLRSSSIVSVHLFFNRKISDSMIPENSFGMTGLIGTKVQWIFKRSDSHLSLVISGADDLGIKEMENEEIFRLCLTELKSTLTGFNESDVYGYKVIKEKRATFIPDLESRKYRPKQVTSYRNLFIAGDWTDTGLPATIESAVKSAKICAEEICKMNKNFYKERN